MQGIAWWCSEIRFPYRLTALKTLPNASECGVLPADDHSGGSYFCRYQVPHERYDDAVRIEDRMNKAERLLLDSVVRALPAGWFLADSPLGTEFQGPDGDEGLQIRIRRACQGSGTVNDFFISQCIEMVMPGPFRYETSVPGVSTVPESVRPEGTRPSLPQPKRIRSTSAIPEGTTLLTIKNQTQYTLSIGFRGPVERTVVISPKSQRLITLSAGGYEVRGSAISEGAQPFMGHHMYEAQAEYEVQINSVERKPQ